MTNPYNTYGEILETVEEIAEFCGVSKPTFQKWLKDNMTPMGAISKGTHYFDVGTDIKPSYRFIKRQFGLLFKMIEG